MIREVKRKVGARKSLRRIIKEEERLKMKRVETEEQGQEAVHMCMRVRAHVHRGNRVLRKKLTKQKEKLTRLTCFGWFSSPGLTLRHTREDSLKID